MIRSRQARTVRGGSNIGEGTGGFRQTMVAAICANGECRIGRAGRRLARTGSATEQEGSSVALHLVHSDGRGNRGNVGVAYPSEPDMTTARRIILLMSRHPHARWTIDELSERLDIEPAVILANLAFIIAADPARAIQRRGDEYIWTL